MAAATAGIAAPTQLAPNAFSSVTSASDYVKMVSPAGSGSAAGHGGEGTSRSPKAPLLPPPPPNKPALFGSVGGAAGGVGGASLLAAALVGLLAFVFPSRSTSRVASVSTVPRAYRYRLSLERPG